MKSFISILIVLAACVIAETWAQGKNCGDTIVRYPILASSLRNQGDGGSIGNDRIDPVVGGDNVHLFAHRSDMRLESLNTAAFSRAGNANARMCLEVTFSLKDVTYAECDCEKYTQVFYFVRPASTFAANTPRYLIFHPLTQTVLGFDDDGDVIAEDYEETTDNNLDNMFLWRVANNNFFAL